jgi:hypothetical protein
MRFHDGFDDGVSPIQALLHRRFTGMKKLFFSLAVFVVLGATASFARTEKDVFGSWLLKAESGGKKYVGTLVIEPHLAGMANKVVAVRKVKPEGTDDRVEVWEGEGKLEGSRIVVEFELSRERRGISDILSGTARETEEKKVTATYTLVSDKVIKGEWHSTSDASMKGKDAAERMEVRKCPLGGSVFSGRNDGWFGIYVPTEGTLRIEVSEGKASLYYPDRSTVVVKEVARNDPYEVTKGKHGWYYVKVTGASSERYVLENTFVQEAMIGEENRPWSIETHWMLCDRYESGGEIENLYDKNGPLWKFDRALGLNGKNCAVHWEKGGTIRAGFGYDAGHYVAVNCPHEKTAEVDWHADLNRNGVIEAGKEDLLKLYDADGDGKISRKEVEYKSLADIFLGYDANFDGFLDSREVAIYFIGSHDKNGDKKLSEREFVDGERENFKDTIERKVRTFFKNDRDRDGFVDESELSEGGRVDFMDSSDVDQDGNRLMDRDNAEVVLRDGRRLCGNRVVESGNEVKIYGGPLGDRLLHTVKKADVVETRLYGIADGDFDDSYDVTSWGHLVGWSMAAILFREPGEGFTVNGVPFSIKDQKGILAAHGMGDSREATFSWKKGDIFAPRIKDPADYAAGFHTFLKTWLRDAHRGVLCDTYLKAPDERRDAPIWNCPVFGYRAELKEAEDYNNVYIVEVKNTLYNARCETFSFPGTVRCTYRLHFDRDGNVSGDPGSKTAWTTDGTCSEDDCGGHRDAKANLKYFRYLIHPFEIVGPGDSGNPYVNRGNLKKLLGDRLKYNKIGG